MQADTTIIKPIVILPNSRAFYALVSLLSVGIAAVVAVCILAIAALMYTLAPGLSLFYGVFVQITSYADHSNLLTRILLLLAISYGMSKVFPAIARGVKGSAAFFKGF